MEVNSVLDNAKKRELTVFENWQRVLVLFLQSNLRLSPTKTVIAPCKTVILGWNWQDGVISVSALMRQRLGTIIVNFAVVQSMASRKMD